MNTITNSGGYYCSPYFLGSGATSIDSQGRAVSFDKGRATMKAVLSMIIFAVLATCFADPLRGSEPLEPIHLPPPETIGGMPLMQALKNRKSTKEFTNKAIPRGQISNLLWAAFGINRPESGKRTAATALNCQDIEVFVVFERAT